MSVYCIGGRCITQNRRRRPAFVGARTTFAKIAAPAGVSAETVQGYGPKAALMIAAIEYSAFGVSGEENVLNLDAGRQLLAVEDRTAAADALAVMH
jgi:hypothetical protein